MNKRISTMFASFLLMAGVAFAADGTTYSQKEAKPTEGLKVYLGNEEGTSFLKSAKVTDAAYKFANTVTESEAGVFTVTGVKTENGKLMFKLVDAAGLVIIRLAGFSGLFRRSGILFHSDLKGNRLALIGHSNGLFARGGGIEPAHLIISS